MLFLCWTICNIYVIQMWVIMFCWKSILINFVVFSYLQISFLIYLLLQTNELPSSFCFLKPVQFWLLTNTGSSNLNYWTVLSSSSFAYWIPYFITVHLFLYPPQTNLRGYIVILMSVRSFVRSSVRSSVRPSVPLNL